MEEERVIMLTLSQISCSKMVRSKKGAYKPDSRSSRVEVVLQSGESYDSTTLKACYALGMIERGCAQPNCLLLRMSGAVIPNKDVNGRTWTIGNYVDYAFSARSRANIGVYVQSDSVSWYITKCVSFRLIFSLQVIPFKCFLSETHVHKSMTL